MLTGGHGPDFKARTDLRIREEKARIKAGQNQSAPERLDHRHPNPQQNETSEQPDGVLRRLWQRVHS